MQHDGSFRQDSRPTEKSGGLRRRFLHNAYTGNAERRRPIDGRPLRGVGNEAEIQGAQRQEFEVPGIPSGWRPVFYRCASADSCASFPALKAA